VRVYREWKGLPAKVLASSAGISAGHLSDIESGRLTASAEVRKALTQALELEPDDLEPANME
jgi:transcriptional regulator with XRE-family HTH domain